LHDDHRFGRKKPNMMLIGVDYHPSFKTIAFFVEETQKAFDRADIVRDVRFGDYTSKGRASEPR
jgi:hypothetical protein